MLQGAATSEQSFVTRISAMQSAANPTAPTAQSSPVPASIVQPEEPMIFAKPPKMNEHLLKKHWGKEGETPFPQKKSDLVEDPLPLEGLPVFDILEDDALPKSEYPYPLIIRQGYKEINEKLVANISEGERRGICIYGHPGSGESNGSSLLTPKARAPVSGIFSFTCFVADSLSCGSKT